MPDLSDRIREAREALGLSQQALAEKCGVTARSQRNYESGERNPDAAYLTALAAAGANVLYVLTGQPIAETTSAAAQGIDAVRLTIAIEAVEEGLEETRRRLAPRKKAELVMAAYELINQTSQSRDNVIRLVRMAA